MAKRIDALRIEADDVVPNNAVAARYDIAFWAAGYEARSSWLVQSSFRPPDVAKWWKIEFDESRTALSSPQTRAVSLGDLLGATPGKQNRDGYWVLQWQSVIRSAGISKGGRLDMFIDYSSMPRTVYGSLVIECLRTLRQYVRSITLAYVPGQHAQDIEGSRGVEGLRSLIGTEGSAAHDRAAFVIGLGYDGVLVETIVELFQVGHFSCYYGFPGVTPSSVDRVLKANAGILSRSELIARAPAWSVGAALDEINRLCDWYANYRDVILLPLGPKPHIVAAILAAALNPDIGFRFPQTSRVRPVEVTVAGDAVPYFTRISLED